MKQFKFGFALLLVVAMLLSFFVGLYVGKRAKGSEFQIATQKAETTEGTTAQTASSETVPQSERINLNTATKEELMSLPGIGEATAEKIVDYRETYGNFASVEELTMVNGIGEKKLENLMQYVTVEDTTAESTVTEASRTVPESEKINLNTATKEELISLPGIGETIAERIIDYRETYGNFASVEELTMVKGIGDKKLETLKELVTVEDIP